MKTEFKRPSDAYLLYDNKPADIWEQAYPLGNGKLGLMVYGGTKREVLSANEDTLWSGYPRQYDFKSKGIESFRRIKELTLAGRYVEADREATDNFTSYGVEAFLPMGDIVIDFASCGKVTGYRRYLDLGKAVNVVSYAENGKKTRSVSFVSHPAGGMFYRIGREGGGLELSITMTSRLYSRVYDEDGKLYLEGECYQNADQNRARTDRKALYGDTPETRGIRFLWALGVLTDGESRTEGDTIVIKKASYVDLRSTARTSFNGYPKHPFTEGREYREAAKSALSALLALDYDTVLAGHIKDHGKYFGRVRLDVGSDKRSGVPTEKRLSDFADGVSDRALPTLLFNYGRYLTIAGSRKGSEALNLQGIWNKHLLPPWQSDYTVNINLQMNYFPTLAISLPEMYEPLIRMIKELSETGKIIAEKLYGAKGWVCHHNTDIWRSAQPVAGLAVWSFWCGGGGWLCHHLAEYYEYTLDRKFLEKTALPIMKGAAEFYLSVLDRTPDGYLAVVPSTSPENRFLFEGKRCAVSETTEMTMAIVRELFGNVIAFSEIVGAESDETLRKVKEAYPGLRPPMIGSDGRLLEWYGEPEEGEVHHRHVSHLYGLHPDMQITPEKTPELADACRKTLEVRGDAGTGWSLAWKANFYARLHDGDHAFSLLRQQLKLCGVTGAVMGGGGTYPNMFCAHPPFQIDGNFGITSGVAEMLLQSEGDEMYLIPALPSEWGEMKVSGLSAKGDRRVSMTISGGKLVECIIDGTLPKRVTAAGEDITDRFVRSVTRNAVSRERFVFVL